MKTTLFALTMTLSLIAAAQTVLPKDFPEGATPLAAPELKERVAGKVFKVSLADGGSWRLEYRANGYFFINTSGGFNSSGQWRTEDSKLCSQGKSIPTACNEVRLSGELMHLKRTNGEVIALVPN